MNNSKIFMIILAVVVIVGGIAIGFKILGVDDLTQGSAESEVICTADAKMCPDGSYVGRQGPGCEFAPCK